MNRVFKIDRLDPVMCAWALSYLTQRLPSPPKAMAHKSNPFEQVMALILSIQNEGERELLLRKMRAAWSQKNLRKRGDRNTCTYLLTTQTKQKLADIAESKGLHINKTLEAIIDQTYKGLVRKKQIPRAPKVINGPGKLRSVEDILANSGKNAPPNPDIKIV